MAVDGDVNRREQVEEGRMEEESSGRETWNIWAFRSNVET